ncbi:hypothetical protein ASF03_21250 [Rhizobium sp. Leaf68]|nr:hypothetical protein ASE62_20705 [Rhizobium sp. Leaf202]KQN80451.1 hypothetical protein ASF03_21250 [Rhizobium sp. Leaf68]
MAPVFNPRDKSRTSAGKTFNMVKKHTQPPTDQGGWMAISRELLESAAYRSLSVNGRKALDRLIIEHISHGRAENGKLIVTHDQLYEYGVTFGSIADALEELAYKKLIKMVKGRAGNGTAHPTVFTLTFDGTYEGAAATNEWKRFTMAEARLWSEVVKKQLADARAKPGRKKKSSLRETVVPPLRVPVVRSQNGE